MVTPQIPEGSSVSLRESKGEEMNQSAHFYYSSAVKKDSGGINSMHSTNLHSSSQFLTSTKTIASCTNKQTYTDLCILARILHPPPQVKALWGSAQK